MIMRPRMKFRKPFETIQIKTKRSPSAGRTQLVPWTKSVNALKNWGIPSIENM